MYIVDENGVAQKKRVLKPQHSEIWYRKKKLDEDLTLATYRNSDSIVIKKKMESVDNDNSKR